MTERSASQPLPSPIERDRRVRRVFGVTLSVGLAPLIGALKLPVFREILSLFPLDLQVLVIPCAAVLMALPLLFVEFVATTDGLSRRIRAMMFGCGLAAVVICSAMLYARYLYSVKRISSAGGVTAYVVGSHLLPDSECAKADLPIEQCIGRKISTEPNAVATQYDGDEITGRKLTLSGLYMATMLGFGVMIASMIVRERKRVEGKVSSDGAPATDCIFIGHGRDPQWKDLADFIRTRMKLPIEEFNHHPSAGMTTQERLDEMLQRATFALLIMSAEDEHADSTKHARENVIHEIGRAQQKLGLRRAIILLEDGCGEFSNMAGVNQIRFPKGYISAAFEEIRRVLEREGLVPA